MYIPQKQISNLKQLLTPEKVLIVYGARRVGKTTLLKHFLQTYKDKERILFVNGDDITVRQYLESQSVSKLRDFIGEHTLLVIDEAQYVEKIGLNLKLIVDHVPNLKIIATGSSSFELAKDVGEPLTGRKYVLTLFPLAQMEISEVGKWHETTANLESRLIYGSYPEVVIMHDNKKRQEYLNELISSYLFKDVLALEGIRYSNKLVRLLQLLAFQIGKEVSITELGTQLGMSKNTVDRYLDLMEKVFVIFKVNGYSRNLRKEVTKNARYYFYDVGIRNAVIRNYQPFDFRDDIGAVWENYVIVERKKRNEYLRELATSYFWRTYDRQEIDLVEQREGGIHGYEIKWQALQLKRPREWKEYYPNAGFNVINQDNYLDFIL